MNFGEKLQNLVLSSVVILTFCSLCSIIPTEMSNQISTLFSAVSLSTPLSIVIVMMVMVMMVFFIVLTGFFVLLIHLFVMFVTVFEIILIVVVIPVVVVFVASANGD